MNNIAICLNLIRQVFLPSLCAVCKRTSVLMLTILIFLPAAVADESPMSLAEQAALEQAQIIKAAEWVALCENSLRYGSAEEKQTLQELLGDAGCEHLPLIQNPVVE